VRPSAPSGKKRRAKLSLTTVTPGAPTASSRAAMLRPATIGMPSVSK
jgi:hypothetical protein